MFMKGGCRSPFEMICRECCNFGNVEVGKEIILRAYMGYKKKKKDSKMLEF